MLSDDPATSAEGDHNKRSRRFRFKRKREAGNEQQDERLRRHHRHHHRRHRSGRTGPSQVIDDPSTYDDSVSKLPPDVAFRESLFDAMGDDEGAEFWQGVYGQPIHDYPNTFHNEETGELDELNDEEYAAFVRRKMWERSREGIEAAREEKKRQERKAQKERKEKATSSNSAEESYNIRNDFLFDLEIDESLKRGAARKDQKKWKTLWQDYEQRWSGLRKLAEKHVRDDSDAQTLFLRDKIPWPVASGKRKDVDAVYIEDFLRKCADATAQAESGSSTYRNILKAERVRFHPDKIQHHYGVMNIDQDTLQGVTAVFQILDQLWIQARDKES